MVIVIGIQKVSLGEQGIFCGTSSWKARGCLFWKGLSQLLPLVIQFRVGKLFKSMRLTASNKMTLINAAQPRLTRKF